MPRYAGRPASAATATGLMSKHLAELKAFLAEALTLILVRGVALSPREGRHETLAHGVPRIARTDMADIVVPTLGESVTEATIGKWFKHPGDAVAVDEPVVELETDKVTIEVAAADRGRALGHRRQGRRDGRGRRAARSDPGGRRAQARPGGRTPRPMRRSRSAPAPEEPKPKTPQPRAPQPPAPAPQPRATPADVPLAPSVRKLAAESGLDAAIVPGSGKDGRVTKGDMLAAIERAAAQPTPVAQPAAAVQVRAPSPADDAAREERVKMTRLRQTIARRLKDAQNTAAMLTTFNEVDMSEVMKLRNQYKDLFEKKHGVKLGFMGFFVQGLRAGAAGDPRRQRRDRRHRHRLQELLPRRHRGRHRARPGGAGGARLRREIASPRSRSEIADFGRRARDGALKIEEMQGGTFTITNGGVYGSLMSTPILNAPQSGILGMHKIQERPMAIGRQGRDPADDVFGAVLRPPHRRRPRGGDVPGAGQGGA